MNHRTLTMTNLLNLTHTTREGAAWPRRDTAAAVAGISEPASGGRPLHPVLRAFPCLAATLPAADDAPAASRRRGARSRLRRHDAERHRQGCRPPGAGFRCLLALLGPDLRRSELDPRSRGLARCPCPRLPPISAAARRR